MNEKEIGELRRRFRVDKSNITHVCGCYVNEKKEIVSKFDQPFAVMPQEDTERILGILKKTLSGTVDKNLLKIEFTTQQVMDSEEHRLLMGLRESSLKEESLVDAFYQKVIEGLEMEESYLILLAQDTYDVPYRQEGEEGDEETSWGVYRYIICAVCPIKMTKPALRYDIPANRFCSSQTDWIVGAPEIGFLFPAFEDRQANLYEALYYSKNTGSNHPEFADTIFHTQIAMPADSQKELFSMVLEDSLGKDCSLQVIQAVQDEFREMVEEHKSNKEEPLVMDKKTVKAVLETCGIPQESVTAFEEKYDTEFGENAQLNPQNVMDGKQMRITTPDVTIRVNPDRSDLIETRVIDGIKYILIRANEGVEVNGVSIHI